MIKNMMNNGTSDYRVIVKTYPEGGILFYIGLCFYNETGNPIIIGSVPETIIGHSLEELNENILRMQKAHRRPILIGDEGENFLKEYTPQD